MNANFDATAATHGVPITSPGRVNEDIEDDGVATGQGSDVTDEKLAPPGEFETAEGEAKEMDRRQSVVQALARSYSRASATAEGGNPFLAGEDSPLNPSSANFSGREWAKAVAAMVHDSGSTFRQAGVCFQNLNVYGYGASTDYQKDVFNVWLSLAGSVSAKRQRIDICRGFDGLVNQGEMLVVLGPPGSGCSTFLKTIAGEMNGIYVDDDSYFNYQGKPCDT